MTECVEWQETPVLDEMVDIGYILEAALILALGITGACLIFTGVVFLLK